jgi:hypothetical protein
MFRLNRALVALVLAAAFVAAGTVVAAGQDKPVTPTKWVETLKGDADIQFIMGKPVVRKDGMIETIVQVKNMSPKAVARLEVQENWYNAGGDPVTGDRKFLKKPLLPGETATITLETPKKPNMDRNSYKFSHANGNVKPKKVTKF